MKLAGVKNVDLWAELVAKLSGLPMVRSALIWAVPYPLGWEDLPAVTQNLYFVNCMVSYCLALAKALFQWY